MRSCRNCPRLFGVGALIEKNLDYYMRLSYRVEVIEDKEEGGYALHCPGLPGCITCAETVEEGTEMIEDAKRCWFSACLEDGRPIPEPANLEDYSEQFKLRLPKFLPKNPGKKGAQ